MRVFLFRSDRDHLVYAYSASLMAERLPAEHAPWRPFAMGTSFRIENLREQEAADIRECGYSVFWLEPVPDGRP